MNDYHFKDGGTGEQPGRYLGSLRKLHKFNIMSILLVAAVHAFGLCSEWLNPYFIAFYVVQSICGIFWIWFYATLMRKGRSC